MICKQNENYNYLRHYDIRKPCRVLLHLVSVNGEKVGELGSRRGSIIIVVLIKIFIMVIIIFTVNITIIIIEKGGWARIQERGDGGPLIKICLGGLCEYGDPRPRTMKWLQTMQCRV